MTPQTCGSAELYRLPTTTWAFRRSLCTGCQKKAWVFGRSALSSSCRFVADAPSPNRDSGYASSLSLYWHCAFMADVFPGVTDRRVFLCCPSFTKRVDVTHETYSLYLRTDIEAAIEMVEAADAKGIGEDDDALAQAIERARQRTAEGTAVRQWHARHWLIPQLVAAVARVKAQLNAEWLFDQTIIYAARRALFRTEVERRLQELGYVADDYQHLTESDYSCPVGVLSRYEVHLFHGLHGLKPHHAVLEDLSEARAFSVCC